ncbi:MAG: trypsin-like peptidase domain-containing protein, partial [Brachymonas sp.]|nr:trypsin-like peptidase domain-containing protein [Brachymonas sp.]
SDGRRTTASIIGTDPETDLAVLKIDLGTVPSIALGDSGSLQVGDPVLAIGNPFGVGQTVTSGIVSALGRSELGINTFENFIQTDAAINPGNSGGALVDISGNLVGINTAIYSRTGGYMGIGFATPTSMAKQVLEDIVKSGHVTRGWIGVEPGNISAEIAAAFGGKENEGVIVTGVVQDSPAAQAGVLPGDIISRVNTQPIRNVQDLLATVSGLKPGTPATLSVSRKFEAMTLEITPQQRPKPVTNTKASGQ